MRILSGIVPWPPDLQELDDTIGVVPPIDATCCKFRRGGTMEHLDLSVRSVEQTCSGSRYLVSCHQLTGRQELVGLHSGLILQCKIHFL